MPSGKTYSAKRSFDETPEPPPAVEGDVDPGTAPPGTTFVIHQHHARRLHFDLRLEMMNGDTPVLVSWAVPKNLPLKPGKPNLAVHVEDHPFDYGSFSGTIPAGNYGAGEVRIFDSGTYEVLEQESGKLSFRLAGRRMQGVWHLFKTTPKKGDDGDNWLVRLRKLERDEPDPLPPLQPMLATTTGAAFDDDDWLFEPKWDGVRCMATCSDETMLISRNSRDISATYPELGKLHERLVAIDAILDGEIVTLSNGRPSFERLQSRMNLQNTHEIARASKAMPVLFVAFDLLYLDGKSLVTRPLEERKELLSELVVPNESIQVSTVVPGEGTALFEAARAQNLEGIVAKKRKCPYQPGKRSRDWLKIKTIYDADVVVAGWSAGEGSRSSSFGALIVGAYDDRGLRFVGLVGTGFSDSTIKDLMPMLEERARDDMPFVDDPRKLTSGRFGKPIRDARWVTPDLVARVEFRELTSAGKLRAPSFKGLNYDKLPEDCTFEDLEPPAPA
jgi:bifunctional non-homologous end joining protein LigD